MNCLLNFECLTTKIFASVNGSKSFQVSIVSRAVMICMVISPVVLSDNVLYADNLCLVLLKPEKLIRKGQHLYILHLFILQNRDVSCSRPLVELTPTSCVVGGVTERYLGNINLFFIRESLSVREVWQMLWFLPSCRLEKTTLRRL